jgi:hypothetical protein
MGLGGSTHSLFQLFHRNHIATAIFHDYCARDNYFRPTGIGILVNRGGRNMRFIDTVIEIGL